MSLLVDYNISFSTDYKYLSRNLRFLDCRDRIRIVHRLMVSLIHQVFVMILCVYPYLWQQGHDQISAMEKYGPIMFYSTFVFFGSIWIFYDPKMTPPNPEVLHK